MPSWGAGQREGTSAGARPRPHGGFRRLLGLGVILYLSLKKAASRWDAEGIPLSKPEGPQDRSGYAIQQVQGVLPPDATSVSAKAVGRASSVRWLVCGEGYPAASGEPPGKTAVRYLGKVGMLDDADPAIAALCSFNASPGRKPPMGEDKCRAARYGVGNHATA